MSKSVVAICVHSLEASERRMLLEMLASERSGELALHVGPFFDREITADSLCLHDMAMRYVGKLIFTPHGRQVAELLADKLVARTLAAGVLS